MHCPACDTFNSSLDEECEQCGLSLLEPRPQVSQGKPYRKSEQPITPEVSERKRLRSWLREALRQGEAEEELSESLVRKGYDPEWSTSFVASVAAKYAGDEPRVEPLGNYGLGFLLGFFCTGPVAIYLLVGAGRRDTRRGAIAGLACGFGLALIWALLEKR